MKEEEGEGKVLGVIFGEGVVYYLKRSRVGVGGGGGW